MENLNKKRYYKAVRGVQPYALHCSAREAYTMGYILENVSPCSKAEYLAARAAGANSYADALEIWERRCGR